MRRAAASTTRRSRRPISPTSAAPPSPSLIAATGSIRHRRTTEIRRRHTTRPPTRSSWTSDDGAGPFRIMTVDATGSPCSAASAAAYSNTRSASPLRFFISNSRCRRYTSRPRFSFSTKSGRRVTALSSGTRRDTTRACRSPVTGSRSVARSLKSFFKARSASMAQAYAGEWTAKVRIALSLSGTSTSRVPEESAGGPEDSSSPCETKLLGMTR